MTCDVFFFKPVTEIYNRYCDSLQNLEHIMKRIYWFCHWICWLLIHTRIWLIRPWNTLGE